MRVQRIQDIKNLVQELGTISIDDLVERFGVSKNTIRRDINILEEEGSIEKVYGGIQSKNQALKPFTTRQVIHSEEKQHIGELASSFIKENDIVFIDSGTTTSQILPFIDPNLSFTILTTSVDVIQQSMNFENIQVFILGTKLKRETRSFIYDQNNIKIDNYNISKAFMACTGFSIKNGLTNSDPMEYEIKRRIIGQSRDIILLADSSKYDHASLMTYAELNVIDYFLTNETPPVHYQEYFAEENIKWLTLESSEA
ncbi:DeoR/GlpR family DNA-binding transcription regulator [Ruoffia tabacinasalis]|uniref:DeoR/GlpR family DNA-binding transcription regulator n=1 Tax=Ruoffia tabacinasalis TaxID=87458 RepID=UPI003F95B37D